MTNLTIDSPTPQKKEEGGDNDSDDVVSIAAVAGGIQWSPVIRAMLNSSALLIVQNWLKDFGRNGPVDPADGPFGQSLVC